MATSVTLPANNLVSETTNDSASSSLAKIGDTITVKFQVNKSELEDGQIAIDGAPVESISTGVLQSNGLYQYTASYKVTSATTPSLTSDVTLFPNGNGGTQQIFKGSVVTDLPQVAPGLTDTSTLTNGFATSTSQTVSGTAVAGSTVKIMDGSVQVGSATADPAGHYSTTVSGLTQGSNTLSATATDKYGVTSAATTIKVNVDTVAPTGTTVVDTTIYKSGTSNYALNGNQTITGTADKGSTVTIYDGTAVLGTAAVGTNGHYSTSVSGLTGGANSLTATATDAAGNTSVASTPYVVNLTSLTDTSTLSNGFATSTTQTITGTTEPNSTVKILDGTVQVGSAIADSAGHYSTTVSGLTQGANTLSTTVTDSKGHSIASGTTTVNVDTAAPNAPTVVDTSPATNGFATSTSQTVTGVAEAGSTVKIMDAGVQVGSTTADPAGHYTTTVSGLSEGANTLSATATDAAGHVSTATSTVVNVDLPPAPPSMTDTSTAADSLASSTTQTITGVAEAGSTVKIMDGNVLVGSTTADPAGHYTTTVSGLSEGANTLSATATDANGVSSAAQNITVNVGHTVTAIDGYVANADVYTDATAVGGVLDANAKLVGHTDANGNVTLAAGTTGNLIFSGGTDTFTGATIAGNMVSDASNTVATPITTLLAAGASASDIAAALHIPAGVDLSTYDPFAAMHSTDPVAAAVGQAVFTAQQQLFTIEQAITATQSSGTVASAQSALVSAIHSAAVTVQANPAATLSDSLSHIATTAITAAVDPADPLAAAKAAAIVHSVDLINTNIATNYANLAADISSGNTSAAQASAALSQTAVTAIQNIATTTDANSITTASQSLNHSIPCYAKGTHIETERGPKLVEELRVGDLILTVDGRYEPVIWLGSRRLITQFQVQKEKAYPVRIMKDAFAENLPVRDLVLSPDHSVYVDGVMIPADKLINGKTIVQEKWSQVTYFHVELPKHEAIYAEGLPAETYLDTSETNRAFFNQAKGDAKVFDASEQYPTPKDVPLWRHIWDTQGYGKLTTKGPKLDEVKQRLNARAGEMIKAQAEAGAVDSVDSVGAVKAA